MTFSEGNQIKAKSVFSVTFGKTSKKTAYFMTSGKKVGGPKTKTEVQNIFLIWTRSYGG